MGERRETYRSKDRRDGRKGRYRCWCGWCARPGRGQLLADLDTDEALELWHGGEPLPERELRIRHSVPPAYREMPWYALANYLEERGRAKDAEYLRSYHPVTCRSHPSQ
jgi:hypothetical protein